MITTPTIPTLSSPQLIDVALLEIQTALTGGLSWLDQAFGKAELVTDKVDNRTVRIPAIYTGGIEYLKMLPDNHIGNFSFFDVEDGEEIEWSEYGTDYINARISLILWFDYRDVYVDPNNRSIENVKKDVKDVLKAMRLTRSHVTFDRFFDQFQNVYGRYQVDHIQNKFWMRPFGCLRIEGDIRIKEKVC